MTNGKGPGPRFQVNLRLLAAGAVLAGVGSMLGLAGLAISSGALAAAARRWANQRGMPPTELAKHHWHKAKAATAAGANAWRDGVTPAGAPGTAGPPRR
jgi:hypothetical protein